MTISCGSLSRRVIKIPLPVDSGSIAISRSVSAAVDDLAEKSAKLIHLAPRFLHAVDDNGCAVLSLSLSSLYLTLTHTHLQQQLPPTCTGGCVRDGVVLRKCAFNPPPPPSELKINSVPP